MNFSLLFEENFDIELSQIFDKLSRTSKNSNKELKNGKQEKESLIDSLRSESNMLLNLIDALENKLEKFSSNNLKIMLCIHTDISNKPDVIVNDLSTSTSHASDSDLDSIDIKHVIEDTACLNYPCLTNHVMPNSKESGIQGKFIPKCHNCGRIGHIRQNCYLLKSHRLWIKQDALRKSEVEDSSSSKYVPPHRTYKR
jgi:hypothetical protein